MIICQAKLFTEIQDRDNHFSHRLLCSKTQRHKDTKTANEICKNLWVGGVWSSMSTVNRKKLGLINHFTFKK